MLPKKKLRPLTKRQIEVLTAIHFGEVRLDWQNYHGTMFSKFKLDGVDVSSVVRILGVRKLIRRKVYHDAVYRGEALYYLAPTDAGLAEIEKHPEQWND